MIRLFNAAAADLRGGWQPSLPLELALAESIESPASAPVGVPPAKNQTSEKGSTRLDQPAAAGKPRGGEKAEKTAGRSGVQKEPEKPAAGKAPEAGAPQAKSSVTLEQASKAWKQVCAQIKPLNPSLNALLNSCKLLEVKEGVLVIGFKSDLLRSKADTPEQMEIIRKAIAEVLGEGIPVRCVVTNARQSAPADVKADGMVAAALKAGGEIVDIQE